MKVNDAVARLVRAGDENSAMWRNIYEAIDELAITLAKYFPGGGVINCVAREGRIGVWFKHWPGCEYEIIEGLIAEKVLSKNSKPREAVLAFCKLVSQGGLLDEISCGLERQTAEVEEAWKNLCKFSERH